jgi:uncharacterized protein YjbJ (UPF0337 family)
MVMDNANTEWNSLKTKIQSKWSQLVDSDVEGVRVNMDLITDKLQKAYGFTKDKAEQEYKDFKQTLDPKDPKALAEEKPKLS